MSMTREGEATYRRCCGPDGSGKADIINPTERFCVGSACMAWRWRPLMTDAAYLAAVTKAMETQPNHKSAVAHVNDNRADYGLPTKPFLGYCGLAGKPEAT